MQAFAELLDRLVLTPVAQRQAAAARRTISAPRPIPTAARRSPRSPAISSIASVKPAMLRELVAERMDAELFGYSYDYVGDLAETIALVWPAPHAEAAQRAPTLSEVVEALHAASRARRAEGWSSAGSTGSTPRARWALLKLVTGGLRDRRLRAARQAGAGRLRRQGRRRDRGALARAEAALRRAVRLAGGQGARSRTSAQPRRSGRSCCRMPLDEARFRQARSRPTTPPSGSGTASACRRCAKAASRRLYSRTGDDISGAFPDLLEALDFEGALDGELLVGATTPTAIASRFRRPAAAAEPQDRPAEADGAAIRPSSAPTTSCSDGARGFAAAALRRAPQAAGGVRRDGSTRRASTCRRSCLSTTGTSSPSCAPIRAASRSSRA